MVGAVVVTARGSCSGWGRLRQIHQRRRSRARRRGLGSAWAIQATSVTLWHRPCSDRPGWRSPCCTRSFSSSYRLWRCRAPWRATTPGPTRWRSPNQPWSLLLGWVVNPLVAAGARRWPCASAVSTCATWSPRSGPGGPDDRHVRLLSARPCTPLEPIAHRLATSRRPSRPWRCAAPSRRCCCSAWRTWPACTCRASACCCRDTRGLQLDHSGARLRP